MIETKRLRIYAASKEQMETFIAKQTIDVLKLAYTEMLNGWAMRREHSKVQPAGKK